MILRSLTFKKFDLEGWGVTVAKVDGTREKELADQYNVAGCPLVGFNV